jgi:fused signal recognition particle receptor
MVFNWFRRKFDDDRENVAPVEKPVDSVTDQITDQTAQISKDPATEGIEPPAQDLLNWAKSAYANIQAREEVNIPEISDSNSPEAADLEIINPEDQNLEIKDSEPEEISSELPQITLVEVPIAESPEIEAAEVIEEIEVLPFWADSDRQARIANLNANAIVEPEIIIPPKPEVLPELPIDQGFLDDGFLWSSEILAAQGRRPQDISVDEIAWLKRLRQGLDKTRLSLVNQLKSLVGKGPLNADAVNEIEALLLQADVGVKATDLIIQKLQTKIRDEVLPPDAAIAFLKLVLQEMLDLPLKSTQIAPRLAPEKNQLNVWLVTGVNGAGKTTTIGKLAHLAKSSGYSILIAAADTFRAAAVQQVQVWGDRSGVEVIANIGKNTDPASVVFDAIISAQSRGTELLLVDTAGRLQNKQNLMDELSKIRRIVDKKATGAKIESLLVLDATLGQNGLKQAEVFAKSAGISGVILTKLDGTARGGVALAVVQQLGLPIRFIGAGEGIDDLRPFSSYEFVEALLST